MAYNNLNRMLTSAYNSPYQIEVSHSGLNKYRIAKLITIKRKDACLMTICLGLYMSLLIMWVSMVYFIKREDEKNIISVFSK